MKNFILITAILLSLANVSFASNIGDGTLTIVESEKVVVTLENETQKNFIVSSAFEMENDNIAIVFESNVSMIQVFNLEGELEMMFPVESEKVNLGMSLFEEGSYRMGFAVEGLDEVQFTSLQIK